MWRVKSALPGTRVRLCLAEVTWKPCSAIMSSTSAVGMKR
jgi:hypothetical protein